MRDSILYRTPPEPLSLLYLAISAVAILLLGYFIFDRLEPRFAEVI